MKVQLGVWVEEHVKMSNGLSYLGKIVLEALGPEAAIVEGVAEARKKNGEEVSWHVLVLTPRTLVAFDLHDPGDASAEDDDLGDQPATIKVATYPLQHISHVKYTASVKLGREIVRKSEAYTAVFVPGCGVMSLPLPPSGVGQIAREDADGYRRVAAALLRTLA